MLARFVIAVAGVGLCCAGVLLVAADRGDGYRPSEGDRAATGWRSPGVASPRTASRGTTGPSDPPLRPIVPTNRPSIAKVTKGPGGLPNDAGQEWRDYDISPYTLRITNTNRPEQAIVDWILRETGYEAWHSEPLAILSASRRTLRVYHTPQMHEIVAEVVDRFVNSEAESQAFGLHLVSVGNPVWRARAQKVLQPVAVQSQGVQAWLLAKEDAALLLAELRRRGDFREHSAPHLLVQSGQATVVAATKATSYKRNVSPISASWSFQPEMASIDEGYSLELAPLLSLDGKTIDAVLKCHVDQVEKLHTVMIDTPTPLAPRQRADVQVPQMSSIRLHERFRWPTDRVLLVSLGIVASPQPAGGVTIPLLAPPTRAELLVFVESRGKLGATAPGAPASGRPPDREAGISRGRY